MPVWITQSRAAQLLGCHVSNVPKLIIKGQLHPRRGHRPSLSLDEVQALAQTRAAAVEERRRLAAERATARGVRRPKLPPDTGHEWLTVAQAAALLGCSQVALRKRMRRGRVPTTPHNGQAWIRRDLFEMVERARTAARTRDPRQPLRAL